MMHTFDILSYLSSLCYFREYSRQYCIWLLSHL